MRVYKYFLTLSVILYFVAFIGSIFFHIYEVGHKFSILSNSNKKNETNRIILYGSSHCDFGISAEKIQSVFKRRTINLCKNGIDYEDFNNYFKNKLFNELTDKDIVVYFFRFNLYTKKIDQEARSWLRSFVPHFRLTISKFFETFNYEKNYYNEYGDNILSINNEFEIKYPMNEINSYKNINNTIKNKIYKFLENKNIKSKVIFVAVPELIAATKKIDVKKITFKCKKNICNNFEAFIKPILVTNLKYFKGMDSEHFNKEHGRPFWTNNLINELEIILNN